MKWRAPLWKKPKRSSRMQVCEVRRLPRRHFGNAALAFRRGFGNRHTVQARPPTRNRRGGEVIRAARSG